MIKVLVVDDSALIRKLFTNVLTIESGFEVEIARNGLEALAQLESFRPDVITLDVQMPQMDGLECLDRIMIERPCPVVMVSSLTAAGASATLEALRLGAVDFVPKPTGAVSLGIAEFAPTLIEKIRVAANAKLRASSRLRERVQHRNARSATRGAAVPLPLPRANARGAGRATGDGLVLVGTSTGGPSALEALLTPLPAEFPWPIVVAQHMPATFTGPLARRLDGICALRVVEVVRQQALQPGYVYIGRGDADLIVSLRLAGLVATPAPAQSGYPWHPSTNRLVKSALECLPAAQLIGVLMTGMGDDGAAAMAELHAQGGQTIAEAEETAVVWGMPGELAKSGGADWIVPLFKIADRLQQLTPANASRS
ncbi:MAG: chemotaxis-specific protein-glutamate methyltransferase CheB [Casimicrobiaceae bacterium]